MAFKRRTRRGNGGDKKSTTFHTDGRGSTRSYSSSSTGKQRTGSGGTRTTTTLRSDGRVTKTTTRHGANGYISRKTKTTGGYKQPKKTRTKLSTPKHRSTKIRSVFSRRRLSSGRTRSYSTRSASPQEMLASLLLMGVLGVIYLIITYWQYILSAICVAIAAGIIYYSSKK